MTFRCTAMSAGQVARVASRICLILFTICALNLSALSQSTTGRILGNVSDSSGAAVAGATVVVTDVQRGTSRVLTTDQAGAYAAPDLAPSTYKIRVEAKGFRAVERPSIVIEVATDVRADFALQPGQVTETVVVEEEVPLVNTTSATLGGTLSNEEINDLPLNGRNYENLLQLRPGVMRYPGGGFSTTSTDGLRAEDNAYFVEGLFNSEPFGPRHHQWRRHRRRFCNDSANRCDPGVQRSGKSSGGIRMEAGSGHQCWIEVRNKFSARHGVCVWPRRRDGRA